MDQHIGFFGLGASLEAAISIKAADVPVDPTVNPTYRVYDGDTLVPNGTGSLSKMDTGTVAGATNATPIVITDVAHGLQTGNIVTITGVGGNTAANGTWVVTRITADTFSLDTSVGNAPYTSGGAWHITGLYALSLTLSSGAGYAVGTTYQARIDWQHSAVNYCKTVFFTVT